MQKGQVSPFISKSSFLIPDDLVLSAWIQHAPFAAWLIECLAPRTFVELGTHRGFSYFAMCQAVRAADLPTACHAVDTWRGDEHAGFYGDEIYRGVVELNRKYAAFSKLIRATFDDAVGAFPDRSIDMLHIDGRHYYEDVKRDFETWRPKMSDGGIVLFHDTNVRDRDFGVWRLFAELREKHPTFELMHGHGLGVVAVGQIPPALKPLFASDEATARFVRDTYSALGDNIQRLYQAHERERAWEDERRACAIATADSARRVAAAGEHIKKVFAKAMTDQRDEFIRLLAQQKRPKPVSDLPAQLRRRNPLARRDAAYKSLVEDYQALASSPLFDPDWYKTKYPDVAEKGEDPVHHYLKFGGTYPMSPSPHFDMYWYLHHNSELRRPDINPLLHFMRKGAAQRRSLGFDPSPDVPSQGDVKAHETGLRCLKTPGIGRENALFVTYSSDGRLKPHAVAHARALRDQGICVTLIVAVDNIFNYRIDDVVDLVDGLYVRSSLGFDFAAWAHVLSEQEMFFLSDVLYLLNDSIIGPTNGLKLERLLDRIRTSDADVVGLTGTSDGGWRLPSSFLALKGGALSSVVVHRFFANVVCLEAKDEATRTYEATMSRQFRYRGLKLDVLFPDEGLDPPDNHPEPKSASLFAWKQLLAAGSPYVEATALREAERRKIDTTGWRELLAADGYDVSLVEQSLASVEGESDRRIERLRGKLEAKPLSDLRLAFVGPWNFGSGLGGSSRGFLSALWHCRFRLNIYPITQAFHIHPRVAPTVSVCDFTGDPDIVFVHVNPDSWPVLLSETHRELIGRARRVVGHWVWEMNEIPEGWYPGMAAVDAIWAPTRYCADIFARRANVPVKVVPYAVPMNTQSATAERLRDARRRCNIPDERKVVLYCFDGSSYLVRKNPFALVSAFERSKLADQGWMLVLKTKNMYEDPALGAKLERLVAACPQAMLLNRPMSRQDLALLMQSADIYASSHCSEGFGLTIAEAMAASKHVVATDFGGSRDFVDETCGYPVDYKLTSLTEDHGHYKSGKVWANIDEDALARALQTAAGAIARGDRTLAEAARARIEQRFSAQAIGASIEAAVADLF